MEKLMVIVLFGLIGLNVTSQTSCRTIKITPDLEIVKISERAYIHISWLNVPGYGRTPANGLIYTEGKEAFLFDTPWNDLQTKQLCSWIEDSLKVKIVGFVPNHWHDDCMGGLKYILSRKIESYANQMTIDMASAKNLPLPVHGFRDSLRLVLDDKPVDCYYLGPAHSSDNIVVWIPSEKILFAGCMVKSMDAVTLGNTADGDMNAYPLTISRLLKRFSGAAVVIPGHGQSGGPELIVHTQKLIQ